MTRSANRTAYAALVLAALPLNLIPVFGVLSAVVLLNEQLVKAQLVGGFLVVAGVAAAQLGGTPVFASGESVPETSSIAAQTTREPSLSMTKRRVSAGCVAR
jgi:hypothetical protein